MLGQHNEADEALDGLAALLDEHIATHPTSSRERTVVAALRRLENRIHEQVYRENQILFRRARALALIG